MDPSMMWLCKGIDTGYILASLRMTVSCTNNMPDILFILKEGKNAKILEMETPSDDYPNKLVAEKLRILTRNWGSNINSSAYPSTDIFPSRFKPFLVCTTSLMAFSVTKLNRIGESESPWFKPEKTVNLAKN